MKNYLNNALGRFRLVAFLEGLSLIILVFVGSPMKYFMDSPQLVKILGPIHGVLFIIYVILAFQIAEEYEWKFSKTTWKVLLASFIPFGTFYIDSKIMKKLVGS